MDIYNEISDIKKKQEEALVLLRNISNKGTADSKEQIYDLTDLEGMLHVSRRTLFKWKSEGKLSCTQIGKKIYVTEKDYQNFLKQHKEAG